LLAEPVDGRGVDVAMAAAQPAARCAAGSRILGDAHATRRRNALLLDLEQVGLARSTRSA